MALPSSGTISLNDIRGDFGGSNPISLGDYYGVASGIPTSGAISLKDFYGASAGVSVRVDVYGSHGGASQSDHHGKGGSVRWYGDVAPGTLVAIGSGTRGSYGEGYSAGGAGGAGSIAYVNGTLGDPIAIAGGGGGGGGLWNQMGPYRGGNGCSGVGRGSPSSSDAYQQVTSEAQGGYSSGGAGGVGRGTAQAGAAWSIGTGGNGADVAFRSGGTTYWNWMNGGMSATRDGDGGGGGGGGGYGGGGGGGSAGHSQGAAGGGTGAFSATNATMTSNSGIGYRDAAGYAEIYINGALATTCSNGTTSSAVVN
jgi:hypothetical protein